VLLQVPKGDGVRPTTDALRQAVFSSLASRIAGVRFADLFAGSGAYGLESLSRGALAGVFVENDARVVTCLRQNIATVCKSIRRHERGLEVLTIDALTWTPVPGEEPDLVFIDPPYEMIEKVAPKLFHRLTAALASRPDPVIVFETPGDLTLGPVGWKCVKRLGKGSRQPTACFFQRD